MMSASFPRTVALALALCLLVIFALVFAPPVAARSGESGGAIHDEAESSAPTPVNAETELPASGEAALAEEESWEGGEAVLAEGENAEGVEAPMPRTPLLHRLYPERYGDGSEPEPSEGGAAATEKGVESYEYPLRPSELEPARGEVTRLEDLRDFSGGVAGDPYLFRIQRPETYGEPIAVRGSPALRARLDHAVLPMVIDLRDGAAISGAERGMAGGAESDFGSGAGGENLSPDAESAALALPAVEALAGFPIDPGAVIAISKRTGAGEAAGDGAREIAGARTGNPDAVRVNRASMDELMSKLDLDARRARYMVDFRTIYGEFGGPEDLVQVAGISDTHVMSWERQDLLRFD